VQAAPFDVIILSIPRSAIAISDAQNWPEGQKIVCGITQNDFDALAQKKNWLLFRVLKDEDYTLRNAHLSAEGALYAAMRQADFSLSRAACTVIGYGRIGKALTGMLRGLGANVTVAARRQESRAQAGEGSIAIEQLPQILPHAQLIFNTAPAPILGKEWLSFVRKDALLVELASPPYGIDLAAAQEMGLRAWGEWGIPGRYCPQSAAELLIDYLEREVFS